MGKGTVATSQDGRQQRSWSHPSGSDSPEVSNGAPPRESDARKAGAQLLTVEGGSEAGGQWLREVQGRG